jgi:hypothetical protein
MDTLPMSSKDVPPKQAKPPLADPHHVSEIFANEFISAGVSPGIATLTFGAMRLNEGDKPDTPPQLERVVVARLVISHEALDQMMNQLIRLNQAIQQQKALAKEKTEATIN